MKAKINGESKEYVASAITIIDLLAIEKVANADMVSVQKNGEFVDRANFETETITENDEVDFLFFMGGGQK